MSRFQPRDSMLLKSMLPAGYGGRCRLQPPLDLGVGLPRGQSQNQSSLEGIAEARILRQVGKLLPLLGCELQRCARPPLDRSRLTTNVFNGTLARRSPNLFQAAPDRIPVL